MTIKQIKVWYNRTIRDKAKREYRVYVSTRDGREGCLYLTGNRWNAKGSREGDLTAEEWAEAQRISFAFSSSGKSWSTVWENEMPGAPVSKAASVILDEEDRDRLDAARRPVPTDRPVHWIEAN